jgi:hypothetical protein
MIRIRTAMATVLAGLVLAAGCSSSGPQPQTFNKPDLGYTISCSAEWDQYEGARASDLQLIPLEQTNTPGFRDSVLVHAETLAKPMTLDEFFTVKSESMSKARPELGLTVSEKGPVTVGGQESRRMIYTMPGAKTPQSAVVWFFVKGDRGYTILATAATERFETMRPKFEVVAQTFRLL